MTDDKELDEDVKKIKNAFPPRWSHPSYRNQYFTESELVVLKMVAYGKTNGEIAKTLFIHPTTVRTHMKHIYAKCDIKGRSRLAIAAYKFYEGVQDA